jgi:hypothetical protein
MTIIQYYVGRSSLKFLKPYLPCLLSTSFPPEDRPQFYEIYKHGAVLGISLTFMTVDCLGGVFSILSLVFKHQFDVLATVSYASVVVRLPTQISIV